MRAGLTQGQLINIPCIYLYAQNQSVEGYDAKEF